MAFIALFDACVLYPAPLRDVLVQLASTGLFRARWSNQIHEEWIRGVLRTKPQLEPHLARTRALMDQAIPDCLVTNYEHFIENVSLPDPGDRHVLAAAVIGRADVIVTKNLKHFPATVLAKFKIEAQHPDVFIRHVLDLDEAKALSAIRAQRERLKSPPQTVDEFLGTLSRQELPETVTFLRRWAGVI